VKLAFQGGSSDEWKRTLPSADPLITWTLSRHSFSARFLATDEILLAVSPPRSTSDTEVAASSLALQEACAYENRCLGSSGNPETLGQDAQRRALAQISFSGWPIPDDPLQPAIHPACLSGCFPERWNRSRPWITTKAEVPNSHNWNSTAHRHHANPSRLETPMQTPSTGPPWV
jgi:hypothetical protein